MNGLIKQWGLHASASGNIITVSYNIKFNQIPSVICVPHNSGSSGPGYGNFGYTIQESDFSVQAWQPFHWFSIGY